jgi:protease IV
MKEFFRSFLASLLAVFVALGLMVLLMIGIVAGIASGASKSEEKLTEKTVLKVDLSNGVRERQGKSGGPFSGGPSGPGMNRLVKVLEDAAEDENIAGIMLHVPSFMGAPSTALDARRAIAEFKEKSGKWVVAYAEEFTQGGYYVASVADEVYLYPTGLVDFRGAFAEIMFFKGMLEKVGVDVQIIRGKNNKFKSAVEPFMYEKMSDANREQMMLMVQGIWDVMTRDISQSRGVSVEKLNEMANGLYFRTSQRALEGKLVDGLKYADEVEDLIKAKLELDKEKDINYMSVNAYANADKKGKKKDDAKGRKDRIAVVYAVGAIESGEGDDETIGSERIAKALRDARSDERTKAIVFRVNSPGGSALASDVIWRETILIRRDSIPFIVSMGDYAASGGYYIAANADRIFANENTLTGSIGVFGMIPNMKKFWNDKVGITFDGVKTNTHSDLMTLNKPLDSAEFEAVQDMVESIYTDFISVVAAGRNLTIEHVDSIGQGRVWLGKDAIKIGLVDEIGNLKDAIKAAAAMAGLEDYKIREYPDMVDPFEQFLKQMSQAEAAMLLAQITPETADMIREAVKVKKLATVKGIQMRMPYWIEFK